MGTNGKDNWREIGVTNWARDCGFGITRQDGRYTMLSLQPPKIVLDQVDLDEVERFLSTR